MPNPLAGLVGATLLLFAPAAVAKEPPKQDTEPPPLSQASCRSEDGLVRVDFVQPDNSTFASGPGECWLTLRETDSGVPLRVYVSLGEPGPEPALYTPDALDSALDWTRRQKLFRGVVEPIGEGTLAMGTGEIRYFRVQGHPTDGPALREAVVAQASGGGHEVMLLAHYDAHNRAGFREQAVALLESMTLHLGPAPTVAENPVPSPRKAGYEREAEVPPAALGEVAGEGVREVPIDDAPPE